MQHEDKNATQRKNVATSHAIDEVSKADLTDKQKRFCLLYLQYFNATKAYLEVYDCSYNTAMVNGSMLLRNTKIKDLLHELTAQQSTDLYITSTELIKREIKMLYASIKDYITIKTVSTARTDYDNKPVLDTSGNQIIDHYNEIYVENPEEMDWSLVSEFRDGKDGTVIKLPDKVKLLKDLLDRLSDNEITDAKLSKIKAEARIKVVQANEVEPDSTSKADKEFGELNDNDLRRLANNDGKYNSTKDLGK
ncbi:terminase small subunit [Apilactobacillus micheneri]|uniref:terminase small subunit n=1 Tax=Apilactobacillus micheneri TaxID=1899430 RepID=UPI001CDAE4D1|nr:terminase small subunit [Apilactobacillus micheneri]